jgi:acyl-CoA thioester hydrolase
MTDDLPLNISRVRLRMYHSDLVNAVYHGRIFELFEEARTEAFRRCGFEYREIDEAGNAMIVTAVAARFHAPARFDEMVQIAVYVDALSKAQVRIGYEGRREGDGTLLVTGETVFAFVSKDSGRPVRVPEGIHRALERCPGMLRDGAGMTPSPGPSPAARERGASLGRPSQPWPL